MQRGNDSPPPSPLAVDRDVFRFRPIDGQQAEAREMKQELVESEEEGQDVTLRLGKIGIVRVVDVDCRRR